MYTPSSFKVNDPSALAELVKQYSFATLITQSQGELHATHVPMLLHGSVSPGGALRFHLARANSQWRHLANGDQALAVFTGPHGYVSPEWYRDHPSVPTWNYTAVHITGRARIIDEPEELATMLSEMVEFYEQPRAKRWDGRLPDEYLQQMLKAIVGVELSIDRVEGKFKLSQNRPNDRMHVAEQFASSQDPQLQELAEWMRRA